MLLGIGWVGIGAITTGVLIPERPHWRHAYFNRAFCRTEYITYCHEVSSCVVEDAFGPAIWARRFMGEWIGRMGSQPQQNKSKYPGSTSMRDYVRSPVMMRLFQGGVLGVAMDNDFRRD
ncbi:hypothetical protein JZX87_29290 [Agrobacterium sp. Ap1]|uniref:hypothetical protein n=1 Tax=Agrobacterium sp. Ap1 TaxID=2815337 RepID=UPI001A8C3D47|nr:hypothetical protein [Agrobacterium sp. Ap1]MBO0145228.1 hypothetical protein [Agrobacterium sp. Ap1]